MSKGFEIFEIIWPSDFDEHTLWLAEERGLLDYVKVRFDGKIYSVCFFTPQRIGEELQALKDSGESSSLAYPGLILVSKITREEITAAVSELARTTYFAQRVPEQPLH